MKTTLIAAALVLFTGSALAEQNAVLQVQGKLTAASCTPELSNGGVIDYGYIHLGSLSASEVNQIGEKNIDLSITCTAPTKAYWTMNDDVHSTNANITIITNGNSNADYYRFGVGQTTEGVNIGNYAVDINTSGVVLADGVSVDNIQKNKDHTTWKAGYIGLRSDGYTMMTVAKQGELNPLAFTTAVFPLLVTLSIQGTDKLAVTDDTPIVGKATITLGYL